MITAGNTPLATLRYRFDGKENTVYAKLEAYNPTGSIKDRIAAFILERAEERGELCPGQPIVEVTSGNTGIAFAALGARTGHPVHIFMPDWASEERKALLRLYGAVLHEVSREEGGFLGAFPLAEALAREIGAYLPRQFENPDNTEAHRLTTGAELLAALPSVTDFVSGVGTGGTLMGVAKALKADHPVTITALEPASAPLLSRGTVLGPHRIEGIGDDLVPPIVDRSLIDRYLLVSDADAIAMAARISAELGLGVGISSGANFLAAVLLNRPGACVATVFADDNKKYLSTDLSAPLSLDEDSPVRRIELLDITVR